MVGIGSLKESYFKSCRHSLSGIRGVSMLYLVRVNKNEVYVSPFPVGN